MINQIVPKTSNNSLAFAPFRNHDGVNYAITKPMPYLTDEEKEKKGGVLGLSLGITAVVLGLGAFTLIKFPQIGGKKMDKFLKAIDKKIDKLSETKGGKKTRSATLTALRGIKSFAIGSKSIFSLAPLKDVIVFKAMDKVPFLKPLSNKITEAFEKISVKTAKNAYNKASKNFDKMYDFFKETNTKILGANHKEIVEIGGVKKTRAEWVKHIEESLEKDVKKGYKEFFTENTLLGRVKGVNNDLSNLGNKVWDKTWKDWNHYFTDKHTYKSFVSEELAAKHKGNLETLVKTKRRAITNSIDDHYLDTKKTFNEIGSLLKSGDTESSEILKGMKNKLKDYKNAAGDGKNTTRENIIKEIDGQLEVLKGRFKDENGIVSCIINSQNVLNKSEKGKLQEILTIYDKLLPTDHYHQVKQSVANATKYLDKAVDTETDKLFDKIRDLKVGSAPSDVLMALLSFGGVAWWLEKAENKDERVSVALKYGIPALGGILTNLYFTVGLVSGGKSLLYGLLSGVALNKLGVMTDKSLKKYKEEQKTFNA